MSLSRRFGAEALGTFVLVFTGCGSAVLAAGFPRVGIGILGVSLAFGIALLCMAYAIGHVSGCHINPAVTLGLAVGRRFPFSEVPAYICAQIIGGTIGAWVVYLIANGRPGGYDLSDGLAANGYGFHSPAGFSLGACLLAEVVLTCVFVLIILGATDRRAPVGFAPIAIGLGLTLVNLVGIPVTNMSANPARSTGPALIVGGWALRQLWLFWLAPLCGGILAGLVYPGVPREAVIEPPVVPVQRAA
jgi:aquaporin Z